MSSIKPSLADLIRTVADEESRRLGPPPSSHDLARYADGDLTEEETERIRDHLALRAEGRDEVLALILPPPTEPPSEEYRVSDDEVDEAWRKLTADLGIPGVSEVKPVEKPDRRSWIVSLKDFFAFPVTVPALAAAMLLGIVGASAWHRDTPWLNVLVVDLERKSHVERSEPGPEEGLPSGGRPQVWNLNVTDLTEYSSYEVEVLGADQEVVWTGRTRERTRARNLNVHVPPKYLDPGIYQVDLYGVQDGGRKLLEEYVVRISP
jgi:hypothetical protein